MKNLIAILLCGLSAAAHAHGGSVSISIGHPGFYGRIDLGGYPAPHLIYNQPMLAHPGAYAATPVYMHVHPKHSKHWHKHCHRYGVCGTPVYFVHDHWYNHVYVPQYRHRHHHGHHHHSHHGHRRHHD